MAACLFWLQPDLILSRPSAFAKQALRSRLDGAALSDTFAGIKVGGTDVSVDLPRIATQTAYTPEIITIGPNN